MRAGSLASLLAAMSYGATVAPTLAFLAAPTIVDVANIAGTGYAIPVAGNAATVSFTARGAVSTAVQWFRTDRLGNRAAISGATLPSYTYFNTNPTVSVPSDLYSFVSCAVTITDALGNSLTAEAVPALDVAPKGVAQFAYATLVWRLTDPNVAGAPPSTVFKKVGVDTLPTGWAYSAAFGEGQGPFNTVYATASNAILDGWDLDGCVIDMSGGSNTALYSGNIVRNCKNIYAIYRVPDIGALITYNTINCPTNRTQSYSNPQNHDEAVSCSPNCQGEISYNRFSNVYQDVIHPGGNVSIHHNDFWPLVTNYGGHADQISCESGGSVGGHGAAMAISFNKLVGRTDGLQTQVFRMAPVGPSVGRPWGYGIDGTTIFNNVVGNYQSGSAAMLASGLDGGTCGPACFNIGVHDNLWSGVDGGGGYFYANQKMGVTTAARNYWIQDGTSELTEYFTVYPVVTTAPTLSAAAVVGTPITLTDGAYSYKTQTPTGGIRGWERSDNLLVQSGGQSYTPVAGDLGFRFRALEIATGTDGSDWAQTATYTAWSNPVTAS